MGNGEITAIDIVYLYGEWIYYVYTEIDIVCLYRNRLMIDEGFAKVYNKN